MKYGFYGIALLYFLTATINLQQTVAKHRQSYSAFHPPSHDANHIQEFHIQCTAITAKQSENQIRFASQSDFVDIRAFVSLIILNFAIGKERHSR